MDYVILFFIYSILGWMMECIKELIITHKFANRGFLFGPYCPIYGCGCLLITFLIDSSKSDLFGVFLKTMFLCSILEYLTSLIMEKIFKARWWDYTNRKFNINGRICLETMIPFGILGCIVLYILNPIFFSLISFIKGKMVICIILLVIFVIDFISSFKIIFNVRGLIKKVAKDNTNEITKLVKNKLMDSSVVYKRIIKAFPKLKIINFKFKKNRD